MKRILADLSKAYCELGWKVRRGLKICAGVRGDGEI